MAKILVVEDEKVAALTIRASLETLQYDVIANVSSGAEAIQLCQVQPPDLILMDICLQGSLDGIDTAQYLRQHMEVPIIFLTACADYQLLQRALETRPFGYLLKPFNPVELYTAIETALRRSQLEHQLETTRQWLSETLNSIAEGAIATNLTGSVTLINPAAAALLGCSDCEAIGQPIEHLLTLLDPATLEAVENPCLKAMREQTTVVLSDPLLLRSRHSGDRWVSSSTAPLRDADHHITGSVMMLQDVTDRRETERLLYRRQQEFRALVENSPDIVARFDANLRYIYINSTVQRITGIPAQAFLGRTNQELEMPRQLSDHWNQAIRAVFLSGQEQVVEFDILTLEGIKAFQARLVPELSPHQSSSPPIIESVLSVARDITSSRHVQESLRQQAERERLLSGITQRIRQSLHLSEILETTVREIHQFLQTDRVIVYQFEADWSGTVIVEAVNDGWIPLQGCRIFDPCLSPETCVIPFTKGYVGNTADVQKSDLAACYVDVLTQFQVQANLVIPILQSDRLWGLLAAQQCETPRQWQDWEVDFLQHLANQVSIALHQSQLYQQTQQQAQREYALNQVILAIRNSLDLSTIFNTAVTEIGQLLKVGQANVVQYLESQQVWVYRATYTQTQAMPKYDDLEVPDSDNAITHRLKHGEIVRINDISFVEDELHQILAQTFPGAWLLLPLQVSGKLWGYIGLIKGPEPYAWQDWQIELMQTLVDQLAIAIQQSELYHQVQILNSNLEAQVQERTAEIRQASNFGVTLKRITDRVRDSLDENQILQTAVQELAIAIGVETCDAAIYDLDAQTSTICYEYTPSEVATRQQVISMFNFSDGYHQLLQGQHFQFCGLSTAEPPEWVAKFSCPIVDDQGVLGDLWLSNPASYVFSEQEIRLVLLVANQCAIALRQARLYRAAQTQVEELERLNRLKDDFLSTISHELRTPIANIRMATQMLEITLNQFENWQPSDRDLSRLQQYMQVLKDESRRETSLIDDLLDLARFEQGGDALTLTDITLHPYLHGLVAPFVERCRSQNQSLTLDCPSTATSLRTDPSRLTRIIVELLNNACKYTPAGEEIRIAIVTTDELIELRVSNSGVEIPPHECDRIFEKFYRIPNQDPWRHGGTGLGLALVQRLVQQLGGVIRVESASNMTGFIISFLR
jgi:PAS domain S-box-containing protein